MYLLMTTSSQGHLVEEILAVEEVILDLRATAQALMGLVFHPWQEVTWDMQQLPSSNTCKSLIHHLAYMYAASYKSLKTQTGED